MDAPKELYYTKEHEWAETEEDVAVIGITDYAQGELGDVVFVELPEVGSVFEAGDAFGTIEAVKAVADLYAPLSGEIIEINGDLEDAPELINQSPYQDGWMVKIRMSNTSELEKMMNAEEYTKMIEG